MPVECDHVFKDSNHCLKCGKSALTLTKEQLRETTIALREWVDAARAIDEKSPGGLQQAKHLAVAAVEALGLDYDETAPIDIREAIAKLKEEAAARAELRELVNDNVTRALEEFMAELLDEAVPAGELWRIVRSVRRCQDDGEARHPHEASSFDALARELVVELYGLGPKRESWRVAVKENDDG